MWRCSELWGHSSSSSSSSSQACWCCRHSASSTDVDRWHLESQPEASLMSPRGAAQLWVKAGGLLAVVLLWPLACRVALCCCVLCAAV